MRAEGGASEGPHRDRDGPKPLAEEEDHTGTREAASGQRAAPSTPHWTCLSEVQTP